MADPTFLRKLEVLMSGFVQLDIAIDGDLIEKLSRRFTDIGRLAQQGVHIWSGGIGRSLKSIATIALNAMAHDDYDKLFGEIEDLHTRKNAGYAGIGADDPWANFRMSAWFGVSPFTGCLIRMTDKLIRVQNLIQNPDADQVNESIKDSLYDMAIYAVIAMCLLDEMVVEESRQRQEVANAAFFKIS